jgi:hypothetical protein
VVVRAGGSGHSAGYGPGSLFARLYRHKGVQSPGGPALTHHRLIFDSLTRWGPSPAKAGPPAYQVFEIVPGARITGRATRGAQVTLRLPIALGARGRMVFTTTGLAGADGRYELVVPYANGAAASEVQPDPSYELLSSGRRVRIAVSDTEVRNGERVEAPPLVD